MYKLTLLQQFLLHPTTGSRRKLLMLFHLSFLYLPLLLCANSTGAKEKKEDRKQIAIEAASSARPIHQISSIGGSTAGALVEGVVGSSRGRSTQRYYSQSQGPTSGYLGPQEEIKPTSFRDQPGVSPTPLAGKDSITFQFHCDDPNSSLIPAVVRPDGTVYQGQSMTAATSPQTLVISSPAQTGIYTLFVLANENTPGKSRATVKTSISTDKKSRTTFHLQTFDSSAETGQDLTSAEFIYTP